MKTFRLIGMAIMAILMSVNFIACSDDGEEPTKNEDGVITSQKRLMRIEEINVDYSNIYTYEFTYDSKGRLSSSSYTETYDGKTSGNICNYTWGNNVIMAEFEDYGYSNASTGKETYFLQDNLIRGIQYRGDYDCEKSLSYNSSKQLTNIQSEYSYGYCSYTETLTWENGKIIRLTDDAEAETDEYTYNGKTCKGYFPLYFPYGVDELFYAHPELVGLRCSQLPEQVHAKIAGREKTSKYSYTFDKDGYVESCTVVKTWKDAADTYTTVYNFTWE